MSRSAASAKTTTNHDVIRRWVEERGGHPATATRTASSRGPGVLRIDYPGYSGGKSLEEISWDDFFEKFDESGLAFLYQDRTAEGNPSRFSKLVRASNAGTKRASSETSTRRNGRGKRAAARTAGSRGTKRVSRTKRASSSKRTTTGRRKRTRSG